MTFNVRDAIVNAYTTDKTKILFPDDWKFLKQNKHINRWIVKNEFYVDWRKLEDLCIRHDVELYDIFHLNGNTVYGTFFGIGKAKVNSFLNDVGASLSKGLKVAEAEEWKDLKNSIILKNTKYLNLRKLIKEERGEAGRLNL